MELVPVEGTVLLDGAAVEGAAVTFAPVAGGPWAAGTTDAGGRFTLFTVNQPGAVPGEHRVTVTKQSMLGLTEDGIPGPQGVTIQWHVPERYSNSETSNLGATVGRGQGELTFRLSSR